MPDKSISQLDQYLPSGGASAHPNDVFVIVDTVDTSMANSGSDKKVTISQFVATSGGGTIPSILDIALNPVAQGDLIYRDSTAWAALAPGTSGYILETQGASANPRWIANTVGTVTSISFTGDNVLFTTGPTTPITTSGSIQPTLVTQAANVVFAGPTTSTATPTFRALVGADIPSKGLTITQWAKSVDVVDGSSGAVTLDFTSTGYNEYVVTLPAAVSHANCAITLGAIAVGQTVKVTTVQDGTGGTTVSWPTTNVTVRWTGGTAPNASTGANKADTFVFYSPSSAIGVGGTVALANF